MNRIGASSAQSSMHGQAQYKCSACNREFTSKGGLKYHEYVNDCSGYSCSVCNREFMSKGGLKFHTDHVCSVTAFTSSSPSYEQDIQSDNPLTDELIRLSGENKLEEVVRLIDLGADRNGKDGFNRTPLHWACAKGHIDVVELLLDRGGDPIAKDRASAKGHLEVVKLLLDRGGDPNAKDRWDHTPLYWASRKEHYEVVKLLSMYTGKTSQHKLIWAATWMEHIGVYHEFRGTQVVIDLYEFIQDELEYIDYSNLDCNQQ